MLGPPKVRDLTHLAVVSLESVVPKAPFYRHLERTLDLTFVRDLVADHYADAGRPSIDPVVFFKLPLVMFFEGIRSEHKLIEIASLNLAHRWYLGYNLDEPLPDHSSLSKIRTRLSLPVFRRFFDVIVEQYAQAGLVWGKELIFDATKVHANAAMDSIQPALHLVVTDHLAALATTDADVPNDAPRWELLEECCLDPDRPQTSKGGRQSDFRRSPTDPDAALMKPKGERACLGYQSHYVVDGGKARIILHALVTPGDVMENQPMPDQLRRVMFRWRVRPKRVIADTTYGTVENIRALEESGIRAYVPLPDWEHQRPFYSPAQFTYDAAQDVYVCPEGTLLRPVRREYTAEKVEYRAAATICNACPMKMACTPSDAGRAVHRSFHAEYLDRVRGYHETEAYAKAMRKRKVWIEPLFGEAKQWHGMRQFRLRGLPKVNMEGLFIAAGQNLKRLLSAKGWRRHPWPDGTTGFAGLMPKTRAMLI
ncbi:MAG: IS1182 family transposase [Thermomicrobia bacterium]|nr:IS1182 family transposase [Thermomicrobia bacterium]